MQTRVVVAVALAAVGGTASFWNLPAIAAPPSVEPVEQVLAQTQGQAYREPTGLFEISFPAGYTYEDTGSGIAFVSADQKFGGSVDYASSQGRVFSLAQLEASLKSEYEKRISNIVWQDSSPQPDGSLRLDWVGRDRSGNMLDAVSFVEQRGNTIFILNLFGINAAYQGYNSDADAIVSTYQVSPAASSPAASSPAASSPAASSPAPSSPAASSSASSALSALVSSALGSPAASSSAPSSPVNRRASPPASRVAQCNQLIAIANHAVSSVQDVTQHSDTDNVAAMSDIADAADRANREMQSLQLTDRQLVGFQNRFMSMYTNTSSATRALVDAANRKDAPAAQRSFEALKTATDREAPLVQEVNRYCTSP